MKKQGMSDEEINIGLTKKGGLLGISGVSNDVRYIEQAMHEGNERAKLALEVFVSGIVHYIGAFSAQMGVLDYLAFTGGIGENSALVRRMVCRTLSGFFDRLFFHALICKKREAKAVSSLGLTLLYFVCLPFNVLS